MAHTVTVTDRRNICHFILNGVTAAYSDVTITLCMQFGQADLQNKEGPVTVGVSMLTSYEKMGVLEMTCTGGCTCKQTMYNTCEPLMHWSEIRWAFQQVQVNALHCQVANSTTFASLSCYDVNFQERCRLHNVQNWLTAPNNAYCCQRG